MQSSGAFLQLLNLSAKAPHTVLNSHIVALSRLYGPLSANV
jgi:hypothetical protein